MVIRGMGQVQRRRHSIPSLAIIAKGFSNSSVTIDQDNPSGNRKKKPTREDLAAVIRRGATGTSMPAFPLLPDQEVQDLIDYVQYLAQRGELEYRILTLFEAEEDVFEDLPRLTEGIPNARRRFAKYALWRMLSNNKSLQSPLIGTRLMSLSCNH